MAYHVQVQHFLYNLLACDPACRALHVMDIMDPIPPIARSDSSRQIQRNKMTSALSDMLKALGLIDYERETRASHPKLAYDEDLPILSQGGLNWPTYLVASDEKNEFATWFLDNTNKDFVYQYHKTFIQTLNSVDPPQSHWLFKTPAHALYFDSLLKYYTEASLIMTHRRLDEVLPSSARLALAYTTPYFDRNKIDIEIDKKMVAELMLQVVDVIIQRIIEFRRSNRDIPVLDVLYEDLLAQPIDTVRKIYEHFGLTWSMDFEQAMLTWLRENPQGKQGRNTYTLEEFGLKRETIEEKYHEYNNMFLKTQQLSEKKSNSS